MLTDHPPPAPIADLTVWNVRPGEPNDEVALVADVDLDVGHVVPHRDLELRRSRTGRLYVWPPMQDLADGTRDFAYRILDEHRPHLFRALFERYRRHVMSNGRNILR